ncbi:helix-turn-helix domain-containing protein [Megasphaera hexanoica]|uniref:Helix-turn-helix domain-containing protein n=1 Tax=Megasphaera hexanoica TaxID=1675036 RepID=A0A848BW59_9FIRM|nr:XRE family transcriptional regulator [Megasphaera hexanoica]AXB83145.1 hypothetical protein ACT01_13405 [Megasphaera hexanoica]MCI5531153.1 XRE family transcriptional regulator [Caecibacter massiliensis]NME27297.1 helix-turn-helix domain-containing protein [Megasphaera hexanoica]
MNYALKIGEKIRSCRLSKQLTVKELAEEAKITPSMLSQIERGQANPSLNTIRLLSTALDEPMFRFFLEDTDVNDDVVRKTNRKHIIENGIDYEMLTPDMSGTVELMQLNLPPNTFSCREPMGHKGEEIALVEKGTVVITVGNNKITLYEGDSIRIKSNTKHSWYNPESDSAIVIFAVSPPSF